jgi:hypothetical protein
VAGRLLLQNLERWGGQPGVAPPPDLVAGARVLRTAYLDLRLGPGRWRLELGRTRLVRLRRQRLASLALAFQLQSRVLSLCVDPQLRRLLESISQLQRKLLEELLLPELARRVAPHPHWGVRVGPRGLRRLLDWLEETREPNPRNTRRDALLGLIPGAVPNLSPAQRLAELEALDAGPFHRELLLSIRELERQLAETPFRSWKGDQMRLLRGAQLDRQRAEAYGALRRLAEPDEWPFWLQPSAAGLRQRANLQRIFRWAVWSTLD